MILYLVHLIWHIMSSDSQIQLNRLSLYNMDSSTHKFREIATMELGDTVVSTASSPQYYAAATLDDKVHIWYLVCDAGRTNSRPWTSSRARASPPTARASSTSSSPPTPPPSQSPPWTPPSTSSTSALVHLPSCRLEHCDRLSGHVLLEAGLLGVLPGHLRGPGWAILLRPPIQGASEKADGGWDLSHVHSQIKHGRPAGSGQQQWRRAHLQPGQGRAPTSSAPWSASRKRSSPPILFSSSGSSCWTSCHSSLPFFSGETGRTKITKVKVFPNILMKLWNGFSKCETKERKCSFTVQQAFQEVGPLQLPISWKQKI